MAFKNAVVLVIDRLGAGWLGPYGNTWLETPNFNRLAAQSLLFETVISDSPELDVVYRSYWTGQHGVVASEPAPPALSALVEQAGAKSLLLTDDQRLAKYPLAGSFSDQTVVPAAAAASNADSIEGTGFYTLFDAARRAVEQRGSIGLVWIHAQGMSGPWDAPLELRYQFADEEDPTPPTFVEPPNLFLPEGFNPDETLGYVQAYAGQVALADICLGMLLDALDEHRQAHETLLIVTSPRGYPLGEHRRVGACDNALHGELLQVPLLFRLPGVEPARRQGIVQPADIYTFIANACRIHPGGVGADAAVESVFRGTRHEAAYVVAASQRAIRTPAWFLRESRDGQEVRQELFAKPDDRYEANEVSSRCGDVVELLATVLNRFEDAAAGRQVAESAPLADVLCDIWR